MRLSVHRCVGEVTAACFEPDYSHPPVGGAAAEAVHPLAAVAAKRTSVAALADGRELIYSYMAAVQQAPVRRGRDGLGMHIDLSTLRRAADRLQYLAGSESPMDTCPNDVSPEDAARRLARA